MTRKVAKGLQGDIIPTNKLDLIQNVCSLVQFKECSEKFF